MAALQEACVSLLVRRGRRASLAPGFCYSVLLPQLMKLVLLSNRSATPLEIINIMVGSRMQDRAGRKRTEWRAGPGNVILQIMPKEKASGAR